MSAACVLRASVRSWACTTSLSKRRLDVIVGVVFVVGVGVGGGLGVVVAGVVVLDASLDGYSFSFLGMHIEMCNVSSRFHYHHDLGQSLFTVGITELVHESIVDIHRNPVIVVSECFL